MRAGVTGLSHYSTVLWLVVICMYLAYLRRLRLSAARAVNWINQHLLTAELILTRFNQVLFSQINNMFTVCSIVTFGN